MQTAVVEETTDENGIPEAMGKVVIIGNTGVGKTCIMLQATKGQFSEEHTVTLGVDFKNQFLLVNKKLCNLQLWDTCGQELHRSMTRVFFKGSDAAFLVYDVTNQSSFEGLRSWLQELKDSTTPEILIYLVGNKIDLPNRAVSKAQAEQFAAQNQLSGCFETSAKSGEGVKPLIRKIAEQIFLPRVQAPLPPPPTTPTVQIHNEPRPVVKARCKC